MLDRVVLRVSGSMPERFLERVLASGICLLRVCRSGERELTIEARASEARRVLALAERYGLRAQVVSERGRAVWARRLRERATLAAGVMLLVGVLMALTSRVWFVDVTATGGDALTVARALDKLGVRRGMASRTLDEDVLALRLTDAVPELTYAGVRLRGVRLQVEATFEDAPPEIYALNEGGDVRAARDAVIAQVDVYAGRAAVKPGDTVRAGQKLIVGEERAGDELTRPVRAQGAVLARTWYASEAKAAISGVERVETGESRVRAALTMPWLEVALAAAEDYPLQRTEVERLPVGGLFVPLHVTRTRKIELTERAFSRDEATIREALRAYTLEAALSMLPEGANPIADWTEYALAGDELTAKTVVEALADIAV